MYVTLSVCLSYLTENCDLKLRSLYVSWSPSLSWAGLNVKLWPTFAVFIISSFTLETGNFGRLSFTFNIVMSNCKHVLCNKLRLSYNGYIYMI